MTSADEWLGIESLDLEAQGVAHNGEGKVVFVEDALPGEEVRVATKRRKNNWEQATLIELRRESSQRVVPRCPHFGACGGCKMQHLDLAAQVATKQRALEDALWHLGKVTPERVLRPMRGPPGTTGTARGSRCATSSRRAPSWSASTSASRASSPTWKLRRRAAPRQRAAAAAARADRARWTRATACRRSSSRSATASPRSCCATWSRWRRRHRGLREFANAHGVAVVAAAERPGDRASARRQRLGACLRLPEFGITMPFKPTDFTQVNHADQPRAGRRARCACSTPQPTNASIDWFCGLGNFTLPLATRGARGARHRRQRGAGRARARSNAARNGLADEDELRGAQPVRDRRRPIWSALGQRRQVADRSAARRRVRARQGARRPCDADRPPRALAPPQRIVYVSCNPATLARDAGLLVHQAGYRCSAAGVVNMFPHTAHVESIAVFDRDEGER